MHETHFGGIALGDEIFTISRAVLFMKPLPSLFKRKLANLLFSVRFYERVSHEDGVFGSNFVSPHFKSNYSGRQKAVPFRTPEKP